MQPNGDPPLMIARSEEAAAVDLRANPSNWFCFSLNGEDVMSSHDLVAWLDSMPPEDRGEVAQCVAMMCQAAATRGRRSEAKIDYRLRDADSWRAVHGRLAAIPGRVRPYLRLVGIEETIEARRISEEAVEVRLAQRSELMDTVVHDLRAPLTVLSASVNLLKTRFPGQMDEAGRMELLNHMERSCYRMERLLRSLLDVAAAEAGHLELEPSPVSLTSFLDRFVRGHRPAAEGRGVMLEWAALTELPPMVLLDEERIEQVLENLLSNALKYTPSGSWVRLFVSAKEHEWIEIAVEDDGPGIAPEDQATLFLPFVRGKRHNGADQSTGLGLAICQRLVEAHGGSIWVESAKGRGATFRFRLPSCAA